MDGDNEPGPPNPGHLLLTHVPDWQCQGVSFAQQIPDIAQQVPELHRPDLVGVPFSHANIIQHVPHAHWQEPGSVPISQPGTIMEQHDTFMVSPCEPNFAQLGCSLPVQHAAQEPGVLPQAFMPASPSVQPSLVEEATPRGVQDLPGAGALLPSTLPPELVVAQRLTSDQSNQYAIVSTQKPQPEINKHPTVLAMPAKLEDLPEKVAVVKLDTGATMAASISKDADETVEWEWARAVSLMGMKTKKHFQYLSRNTDAFKEEFYQAEVGFHAFTYQGRKSGSALTGHHTMQSSALFLMLLLMACNKRFSLDVKQKSLTLASSLLRLASTCIATSFVVGCMVYGQDKAYHAGSLTLEEGCMLSGLSDLLAQSSAAKQLWYQLQKEGLCGHKIRTSLDNPSLWDLILCVLWAKMHPAYRGIWVNVGAFLWPKLVWLSGCLLDSLAKRKADLPLEQVPLVITSKGRARRPPWVNRVVLLQKMRKIKHSRMQTMRTHQDLVTTSDRLVVSEHLLSTGIYLRNSASAFKGASHVTIHWDPSTYDCSTLVAIAYSHQNKIAAYLPVQNIVPLMQHEVDLEIQQLAVRKRVVRMDGYSELRAVSHALRAIGLPLEFFSLPSDLYWGALGQHETREIVNAVVYIVNKLTKQRVPQIPPDFSIHSCPLICSVSDQGGINRASLDYCTYKLGMPLLTMFDPYHRGWNDLRDSLKKSKGSLFKTMLAFSLLWNSNYGPSGSKEWHKKKATVPQGYFSQFSWKFTKVSSVPSFYLCRKKY